MPIHDLIAALGLYNLVIVLAFLRIRLPMQLQKGHIVMWNENVFNDEYEETINCPSIIRMRTVCILILFDMICLTAYHRNDNCGDGQFLLPARR